MAASKPRLTGTELAVSDEDEVLLRGPNVLAGSLDERATDYALRDCWLLTGDEGQFDGAGRLRIDDE